MTDFRFLSAWFPACLLAIAGSYVVAFVFLPGDSSSAARDSEQAGSLEVDFRGKQYTIPTTLKFNNKVWVRESEEPRNNPFVLEYDYYGEDRNVKVRYSQWPEVSDFKESLSTYHRKDEQSPWKKKGKYRYLLKSGVWREITLDPEDGGRANGPYHFSYENGAIKFSGKLIADVESGSAKGYYPDGSLWWSGVFESAAIQWDKTHFFHRDGNEMKGLTRKAKEKQYQLWKNMSVEKRTMENDSYAEQD